MIYHTKEPSTITNHKAKHLLQAHMKKLKTDTEKLTHPKPIYAYMDETRTPNTGRTITRQSEFIIQIGTKDMRLDDDKEIPIDKQKIAECLVVMEHEFCHVRQQFMKSDPTMKMAWAVTKYNRSIYNTGYFNNITELNADRTALERTYAVLTNLAGRQEASNLILRCVTDSPFCSNIRDNDLVDTYFWDTSRAFSSLRRAETDLRNSPVTFDPQSLTTDDALYHMARPGFREKLLTNILQANNLESSLRKITALSTHTFPENEELSALSRQYGISLEKEFPRQLLTEYGLYIPKQPATDIQAQPTKQRPSVKQQTTAVPPPPPPWLAETAAQETVPHQAAASPEF